MVSLRLTMRRGSIAGADSNPTDRVINSRSCRDRKVENVRCGCFVELSRCNRPPSASEAWGHEAHTVFEIEYRELVKGQAVRGEQRVSKVLVWWCCHTNATIWGVVAIQYPNVVGRFGFKQAVGFKYVRRTLRYRPSTGTSRRMTKPQNLYSTYTEWQRMEE
ncbi:hypothetical protein VTI28DRAFT_5345 [Corynascus sepedonium]